MKYRYLLLLIIPFLLNCPKRITPGSRHQIDMYYLGSLTEDLKRPDPLLAGIVDLKGLKVGYLDTDKPGYALFLEKIGLYDLYDSLPLDFLITNYPAHGENHLPVLKTMGYGIKNIEGIRFAILSLGKSALTIQDQTKISLARERSDVLWVIEDKNLNLPPYKISFIVSNRALLDTNQSKIKAKTDPERVKEIAAFARRLQDTLNVAVAPGSQTLAEYLFKKMAGKTGAGVILYPAALVPTTVSRTPITIRDILDNVDGSMRFIKIDMIRDSLLKVQAENNYLLWGTPGKKNTVLIPGPGGEYVLDLLLN
jgi:hypothetical protein